VTVRRGSSAPRLATLAAALRDPTAPTDAAAADRLRFALRAAGLALSGLKT